MIPLLNQKNHFYPFPEGTVLHHTFHLVRVVDPKLSNDIMAMGVPTPESSWDICFLIGLIVGSFFMKIVSCQNIRCALASPAAKIF